MDDRKRAQNASHRAIWTGPTGELGLHLAEEVPSKRVVLWYQSDGTSVLLFLRGLVRYCHIRRKPPLDRYAKEWRKELTAFR